MPEHGATQAESAETGAGTPHSRLWLPLVKRVRQPFLGTWALPGGDLRSDWSLEQSAYSALESTTALHPRYLEQLYTFGGPERSHGGLPMVSVVYWALVGQAEAAHFEDGDNVRWFPEDELPPLAFDHREIIDYALLRLRSKIEYSDVATRLLGPTFTLRQLHGVYEAIAGESLIWRISVAKCSPPAILKTPVRKCVKAVSGRQPCTDMCLSYLPIPERRMNSTAVALRQWPSATNARMCLLH
ncbi:Phosphohydrolase (MutT/nudix family protein) [Bifidobacterium breve]|nr:Phosphohydrolase (MutT/nudix family protein) [Bifidobacterium breve]